MRRYISFFDLLGSKAAAISDPKRYRTMIIVFQKTARRLHEKFQGMKLELYIFSDCAYLECEDFVHLVKFLRELRECLLKEEIFFNAAVCEGKLDARAVGDKDQHFSIVDFQDGQVVKVYSLQSCFSGAGIYIDPDLMKIAEIREDIDKLCVESLYVNIDKFTGKKIFLRCLDVKFGRESVEFLQYILNMYVKCYIQDRRASRYYYTLFTTYIEEQKMGDFLKNKMEYIRVVISMLKYIENFEDKSVILLKLVDRLYAAGSEYYTGKKDAEDLNDKLCKPLSYIYENVKMDKLSNINEYSRIVINDRNKALLAEFCFWKKINDID